ncbi:MAG: threonylcarbamoyl-AMP synthase [Elusimicrobia bacterium]|nr:threonylcarbamoyl-AMP synthase [Elusimicrobiota bacterium]
MMKNRDKVRHISRVLKEGGVVLLPTDTVYGIFTCYRNEKGIDRIYRMKKRDSRKPLVILVHDLDAVWDLADRDEKTELLCREYWPGATTLVMNARNGESIGLRMPDEETLLEIIRETGPLCATSANLSGQSAPASLEDVSPYIREACDLEADFGNTPSGVPSKVIDIREKIKVLRK